MTRHARAPRRPARSTALALAALAILVAAVAAACHGSGGRADSAHSSPADVSTPASAPPSPPADSSQPWSSPSPRRGAVSEKTSGPSPSLRTQQPSAGAGGTGRSSSPIASSDADISQPVATDGDVTVLEPRPKPSKDALWVSVNITNHGAEPARYDAEVRITGAGGYDATVHAVTDILPPGSTASPALTARDTSGTPIPSHLNVTIVKVVRTKS